MVSTNDVAEHARDDKRTTAKDLFVAGITQRRGEIRKSFATNIAKLIDTRQMKQSQLIDQLNAYFAEKEIPSRSKKEGGSKFREIPAWELSRWVRGTVTPDNEAVVAVATIFGVEPDDLVPGIEAEANPDAVVMSMRQAGAGRWYWEFKGVVSADTHRELMRVLSAEG